MTKDPININTPTLIDWFIFEHKDEDSIVGDLCYDLRNDPTYPVGTSKEEQLHHLQLIAANYPQIVDAVTEFLKRLRRYDKIIL